jgi:hypothetical protein
MMDTVDNQTSFDSGNLSDETTTNEVASNEAQSDATDLTQADQDNERSELNALEENADDLSDRKQLQQAYKPFEKGKEKFKINGKEVELGWDEVRKYASLGSSAYQKMQEAAEIKKRAETAYTQLLDLAQRDPEGLLKALNPHWNAQPGKPSQAKGLQNSDQDLDPKDLKIQELERRLNETSSFIEQQQIEAERKAITQEITDAESKYPEIKGNKFAINFIKSEYRRALQSGLDLSIDDVAFQVAQELKDQRMKDTQEKQKRLEQKRKNAPVQTVASGVESSEKPMTLDEVKRLAGRF